MDNSFFLYLEQLELMLFFSGYPLIYLLAGVLGETRLAKKYFNNKIASLLPYAYALTGILYLGLQLNSLYPDYSIEHIRQSALNPFLKIWGLSSILFFIPALGRKPVLSLLHSFVFFFFLAKDLFIHLFYTTDKSVVKNDMNIYSYSLLVNLSAFIFILIVSSLLRRIKNR